MTLLLYYSIAPDLTEEQRIEIEKQIIQDRQTIHFFVGKIKGKIKVVTVAIAFGAVVWFSNPKKADAISIRPPVIRSRALLDENQLRSKSDFDVQIAEPIPRRPDRVIFRSPKEIVYWLYATNPRGEIDPELIYVVKNLRGGSWAGAVVCALLFIALYVANTHGFVRNYPNLGGGARKVLQPNDVQHKYPPILHILNPPRVSYGDRPGGSSLYSENSQSSREELTQVTTEHVKTQKQVSGFIKNGQVDLNQAFTEVNRRASRINSETFDCSFERFKALATECGEIDDGSVREAITILHGEMLGYYKNAERLDYGPNIRGLDFKVEGLGQFSHISHADAKNAVGSAIQEADGFTPNIWKQGKKIAKRSVWQKKYWVQGGQGSQKDGVRADADLPQTKDNVLTVVDTFDVPLYEKQHMNAAVDFGAQDNIINFIILNKNTNIKKKMNKSLQSIIDHYKNGQIETRNLQVKNEKFLTEVIRDERLVSSSFKNLRLINLNFTNVNFNSSFFTECLFENCIFEGGSLQDAEFENCKMINCQITNCNLTRVDFTETTFNKCCFEKVKKGCLVKAWFESCDFINTNFKDFEGMPLVQTAVVDSTFSKFDKSIEFKGEFFLTDILHSVKGINQMFIE